MRTDGKGTDGSNGSGALKIGAIVLLLGGVVAARYFGGDTPPVKSAQPAAQTATQDPHAGHNHAPGQHPGEQPAGNIARLPAPGAVPTALKKTDVKVGTGKTAKAGDHVTVNYRGTLQNGKMFDQSYGRAPFDFTLGQGQVIKGWDEGVAGMKEGGKRKLVIPPDMAYGERGAGRDIPPNATLNFEVELLKVDSSQ